MTPHYPAPPVPSPGPVAALYDLPALLALRAALDELDPAAPSRAFIAHDAGAGTGAIGILPGSFDPLTNAHAALASAALAAGGFDTVWMALSRRTVDKEGVARPSQADRALVLRAWAPPRHGLLLFNRGLYVEQAAAARQSFPNARELSFVVGFDKARQIFDPRYYDDRDAALEALFDAAGLLVAPRAADGVEELAALLDQPENRPFRDHVRALPFHAGYAHDSATAVRELAHAGRPVAELVPPETAAFIAEAHPYDPPGGGTNSLLPDPYAAREAIVAALATDRAWAEAHADLRALLRLAGAEGARGEALRSWLGGSHRSTSELRRLVGEAPQRGNSEHRPGGDRPQPHADS